MMTIDTVTNTTYQMVTIASLGIRARPTAQTTHMAR
jgi:hypothetical protein